MFLSKCKTGTYYLYFRDEAGRRRKVSTKCKYKADALKFLKAFNQAEYLRRAKLQKILLSEFQKEFLAYSTGVHTLKTQLTFKSAFKEFIRIIGDKVLNQVTVKDIEQFLSVKKLEASEWTARKYYISLSAAFERAKLWNYISENPFKKVERPKIPELIPLFFTKQDFNILLSAIKENDLRDIVIIGAYTGLRLNEILNLEWTDIDFKERIIKVQNKNNFRTKTKKFRVVPIVEVVFNTLTARREQLTSEHNLIFHLQGKRYNPEYISKKFKKYVRACGLDERLHFHSLRHTFCSWLAEAGVPLYVISKLAGHSQLKTTELYAHLQKDSIEGYINIAFSKNN